MSSGYVLAGGETISSILNNFVKNTKGLYFDNFTREDISKFYHDVMFGFLHSFGQNFTGKKSYKGYVQAEAKCFTTMRETKMFEKSKFLIDSGGFQVSFGKITLAEAPTLIALYDEFLRDNHHCIDRAFSLDLTPGPGCELFRNFKDVYDMNLQTYTMHANLPDEAREKIIYVHHFRTPEMWRVFDKILRENQFFEKFSHFATGGIVASSGGDMQIPVIIYVLPLIPLLNECIRHGRKTLDFHILGGATYRDILFYEFFQHHVMQCHGIQLNITYDSSGIFKALMIGRFLPIYDPISRSIEKIDVKSNALHFRYNHGMTIGEMYKYVIDRMCDHHNFKHIDMTKIYNDESGTFFEDIKCYSMFYMLQMYSEVQEMLKEEARRLYPLYENFDYEDFTSEISKVTQKINGGKITTKQKFKTNSLIASLDMLKSLDESKCQYIVNKFLSKDEFTELLSGKQLMTF